MKRSSSLCLLTNRIEPNCPFIRCAVAVSRLAEVPQDRDWETKGEMLVENLEPDVLQKVTSVPVTPEMIAVMKDDRLRCFRVRIDTDESQAIDAAVDQKQRTEFLTASVQFLQSVGP